MLHGVAGQGMPARDMADLIGRYLDISVRPMPDQGGAARLLQSPVIAGSFLRFQAAEQENTSLTPQVRQVVVLAVGAVWRSAYELYAHSAVARSVGLPDQVVRALAAGQMPGELSAAEQAAWQFTHQLTTQRHVDQPIYDQAHAVFGAQGITDMLFLIGAYQAVCGILSAFEIPAPETSQTR